MMDRKMKKMIFLFLAVLLLMPSGGVVTPAAGAEPELETVYHEDFSDGLGVAKPAGDADLEVVSDTAFEGNEDGHAVYVSGRTNNWDGIDLSFSDVGMENGQTYTVTVTGYVDEEEDVPEGAQAYLQNGSNFDWIAGSDFEAGEVFSLTGDYTVASEENEVLRIQSNDAGETVPFYVGNILIITEFAADEDDEDSEEENENGESPEAEAVYHETFSDGLGVITPSGSAQLEAVSDTVFEGNEDGYAVYVSGRENNWDGIELPFSSVNMENGKTYSITVTGYVDEDVDVPDGAQALLQNVNSYDGLYLNADFAAGEAFTLTGQYTVDTERDRALRVQSNDAGETVPFYIGDILIVQEESEDEDEEESNDDENQETEVVYHETFSDGTGVAVRAGEIGLEAVSDIVFEGNEDGHAIYVSGRSEGWHGVDIPFSDVGMEDGNTYGITVTGYVDGETDVPAGAQALLQNVDSYDGLYLNADFAAGEAFTLTGQYTVDTDSDRALRIQSNGEGASVPFYIGDILITLEESGYGDDGDEEEEPRPPAEEFVTIDFEDQTTGGFEPRGNSEVLTVTDEANHTDGGAYSLKVEDRSQNWHGPSLRVEQYIDTGEEYNISAWVKLISPSSSQLQLSTQIGSGDSASYNNIHGETISAEDGWVQLEGTYRYNSVGNEYVTIYVESSNNSEASFYIDDISFEPTGSDPIEIEDDLTPIKDVYEDYFLIGNAVSAVDLEGQRGELLTMHHNLATAENAMKPGYAYNEEREFDFTAQNALVESVLAEGLEMHGHVLVWHQQSADWLHTGDDGQLLNRNEALGNLRNHVRTTVEHFGNDVISWDVVNEAIMDNPPDPENWQESLRRSEWYRAIGPDYIEQAFRAAREVVDENGWDIKLYYNDYNDDNRQKAEAIYQMVKEINENYANENGGDLLIDGIGMQGHYNLNTNPENVRLSLEQFASLNVEVGVTELDVTAGSGGVLTEEEAVRQGYLYARLFQLYRENAEHISRVTFWGLNDSSSWRAEQNPLLFDRNLQAKPAYYAVIDPDSFLEEHDFEESEVRKGEALFGTPVMDGTIDEIWDEAPEMVIDQYQTAWQGATGTGRALWDEENLYVLIEVSDPELDDSAADPWEQDSVEVFLDENNSRTSYYGEGHGQYRVNYNNETSFNPPSIAEGFESAAHLSEEGYTVEVKIPFETIVPENNTEIGFDLQINDARNGARESVAAWNDLTGTGFQDPSVFGVLTLVDGLDEGTGPENGDPENGEVETGDPENEETDTTDPENGGTEPEDTDRRESSGKTDSHEDSASEGPDAEEAGTAERRAGHDEIGKTAYGYTAETEEEVAGSKLPVTATSFYTYLLAGTLLLIVGAAVYFVAGRRKTVN